MNTNGIKKVRKGVVVTLFVFVCIRGLLNLSGLALFHLDYPELIGKSKSYNIETLFR